MKLLDKVLLISILFLPLFTKAQNDLSELKKGVFMTYGDFYNNTPVYVDSILIDSIKRAHKNWDTTYNFKLKELHKDKNILGAWGFSDGENAFLYYQNEAWKLNYKEGEYGFIGYGIPKPRSNYFYTGKDNIDGGIEDVYYIFDDRVQIKTPTTYSLEVKNGIVRHKEYGLIHGTGNKKCRIRFYRNEKGESIEPLKFTVGGFLDYHFVPNSYDELVLDVTPEPLEICLTDDNRCFQLDLTLKQEWYFKVSDESNDAIIRQVSTSEGSFDSFHAEKKQEKRKKKQNKLK